MLLRFEILEIENNSGAPAAAAVVFAFQAGRTRRDALVVVLLKYPPNALCNIRSKLRKARRAA
jgi:hypothetical protein